MGARHTPKLCLSVSSAALNDFHCRRCNVLRPVDVPSSASRACTKSHGFTLIELLVVLVLIGIILSFAKISVSQGGDRELETEARRVQALFQVTSEEAVMKSRRFVVQISRDGYRFVQFDKDKWVPLDTDDKLLRPRELPGEIELQLQLAGSDVAVADADHPALIFFLPSGEVMPSFELALVTREFGRYVVSGSEDGQFKSVRHVGGGDG